MADQDRWTEDRDRDRGRYGTDERSRRGFDEYGRRGPYGAGDRDRPGGYGAQGYSEAYGDYGRSFERERSATDYGAGGGQAYGTGYGMGGYRYGEGGYGGRDERYGGQWGRGPDVGAGGGYTGQSYGTPGYGRYGQAEDYARGQGYGSQGYAGQGWRGSEAAQRHDGGQDRTWMERAGEKVASWFGGPDHDRAGHRGRGPKNYTRSDDRIREDINDRLTDDPWLDASEIEVQAKSGEVTLTGTVQQREDKRRAEDLAEQVSGVRHVQNNLRVQTATTGAATATTTAGGTGSTRPM